MNTPELTALLDRLRAEPHESEWLKPTGGTAALVPPYALGVPAVQGGNRRVDQA